MSYCCCTVWFKYKSSLIRSLFSQWHTLNFLTQRPPIINLKLCIFDTLLTPILVQSANIVLRLLKVEQFVSYALLDENPASMLVDD